MHENQSIFINCFVCVAANVEVMETDEEEEEVVMVMIGDAKVPLDEVTPEMVERMTAVEKAEYIRLGQEIHDLYN